MDFLAHFIVGFIIGALGTLVGSGGGFLIVPFLVYMTDFSPQVIAGTSITVAFICSLSGALAFHRKGMIDYKLALILIVAMIPGTLIGFILNQGITLKHYTNLFGTFLLFVSLFLFRNVKLRIPHFIPKPIHHRNKMKTTSGSTFEYEISVRRSAVLSFLVGVFSPLLGIGGGVLRVPPLVMISNMPARVVSAMSQFVTVAGSILAVILFGVNSQIAFEYVVPLAIGAVFGAPFGANVSSKAKKGLVRKIIAFCLFLVGVWMLIQNIGS
ncbi:MAG: sulfite exporter TauE/SafE family protein [Candidatus Altiarchaeota archaeon]|nr:sulfite exporter TauE/SafE family protein [Candidatus Altiarchaeota archaeon]